MIQSVKNQMLHVRFQGQSFDVLVAELDFGTGSTDGEIKRVLASYLDIPHSEIMDYVVDRHRTGNFTVRPQAVFG